MSLKVLGITVTNNQSATNHALGIITNCVQNFHALTVLNVQGMCYSTPQIIFWSVIIIKLPYASSTWSGFTKLRSTGSE
jgi:hypothetical protein